MDLILKKQELDISVSCFDYLVDFLFFGQRILPQFDSS